MKRILFVLLVLLGCELLIDVDYDLSKCELLDEVIIVSDTVQVYKQYDCSGDTVFIK